MKIVLLLLILLASSPLVAQDVYPTRPVRFILPFPPGGGTDILGRLIAERLSASLGQPVVTENRGGAGGNVGAEAAAKSAPDGYTIVLVAPSLAVPNVMITQASLPAQTLQEFIALARNKPGSLNFGSGHLVFIGIPAAVPHIKAGRLRALALVAPQRSSALPEVPTVAEAGLPDFEVTTWYGVLAPAGTPRTIVARLNSELVSIMHSR